MIAVKLSNRTLAALVAGQLAAGRHLPFDDDTLAEIVMAADEIVSAIEVSE